ncbi:hypothetical protein Dimus_036807 [Dionaea muscipula]
MRLPYGDWMTMVFEAFGVPLVNKKGEEPKRYDYFEETFLTMSEEEAEKEEENQTGFDWEAIIDEAATEGESGSDDQFYDAQVGEEEPSVKLSGTSGPDFIFDSARKIENLRESTPRVPLARRRLYEISSEFERKRASRFHDELEKAKVRMPNF